MLLAWLLPDSNYALLHEGWKRPVYRPKHCRPPFVARVWLTLGAGFAQARDRYLGLGEEEGLTRAPRPAS